MDIKALKQYVEKELQAKRFLGEAAEFLDTLDGLKETNAQLIKEAESLNTKKVAAEKLLQTVNAKLEEAETEVKKAEAQALAIARAANLKADKTLDVAFEKIAAVEAQEQKKLDAIKVSIEQAELDLEATLKKVEQGHVDLAKIEKLKQSLQAALK